MCWRAWRRRAPERVEVRDAASVPIAGPADWVAERLSEYLDAGCDGFVVNLGHDAADLDDRIHRFAAEVRPLIAS